MRKKNGRRRPRKYNFDITSFSSFTPESCHWAGFIVADAGSIKNIRLDRKYERYKKYKLQECTKK